MQIKNINIGILIIFLITMVFAFWPSGCDDCNSSDGDISNDSLQPKDTTKVSQSNTTKRISLTIDASGSMKGYMYSDNTEFYQNVGNRLVGEIGKNKNRVQTEFRFWGPNNAAITNTETFLRNLTNPNFTETTSNIIDMLKEVTASIGEGDVRLFITDGVFVDRELLSNQMVGILKTSLGPVFEDKTIAGYVFAGKSTYEARNINLKLTQYPYYLFVFGKNETVNWFLDNIFMPSGYEFEESLIVNATLTNMFVGMDNSMTATTSGPPGEWEFVTKPQSDTDFIKVRNTRNGVLFAFLLNMGKFAPKDSNLLNKSISIEGADEVTIYTHEQYLTTYSPMNTLDNKVTHVVVAKYNIPPIGQNVVLNFKNTDWYKTWSHEVNSTLREHQTENVKHLLDGIVGSQHGSNPTIIITLPVQ